MATPSALFMFVDHAGLISIFLVNVTEILFLFSFIANVTKLNASILNGGGDRDCA